jgi:hypothetical protein
MHTKARVSACDPRAEGSAEGKKRRRSLQKRNQRRRARAMQECAVNAGVLVLAALLAFLVFQELAWLPASFESGSAGDPSSPSQGRDTGRSKTVCPPSPVPYSACPLAVERIAPVCLAGRQRFFCLFLCFSFLFSLFRSAGEPVQRHRHTDQMRGTRVFPWAQCDSRGPPSTCRAPLCA